MDTQSNTQNPQQSNNRGHLTTAEFADAFGVAPSTVRKTYCLKGECYGVRPIKPKGLRGLLWPISAVNAALAGGAA